MGNTASVPKRLDVELELVMRGADQRRGDQLMSVGELPSLLDLAQRQSRPPYVDDRTISEHASPGIQMTHTREVLCEWFALCTRTAAGVVPHPTLGEVPTCHDCADNLDLNLTPFGGVA